MIRRLWRRWVTHRRCDLAYAALHDEVHTLRAERRDLRGRLAVADGQIGELISENHRLRRDIDQLGDQLRAARKEAAAALSASGLADLAAEARRAEDLEYERDQLQAELDKLRDGRGVVPLEDYLRERETMAKLSEQVHQLTMSSIAADRGHAVTCGPASIQIHEPAADGSVTTRMWHLCTCRVARIARALGEPYTTSVITQEALNSLTAHGRDLSGIVTLRQEP